MSSSQKVPLQHVAIETRDFGEYWSPPKTQEYFNPVDLQQEKHCCQALEATKASFDLFLCSPPPSPSGTGTPPRRTDSEWRTRKEGGTLSAAQDLGHQMKSRWTSFNLQIVFCTISFYTWRLMATLEFSCMRTCSNTNWAVHSQSHIPVLNWPEESAI